MTTDSAVRARNTGKEATARRIVWAFETGHIRVRCLADGTGSFIIQGRTAQGWTAIVGHGADPVALLRIMTSSGSVEREVRARVETQARDRNK